MGLKVFSWEANRISRGCQQLSVGRKLPRSHKSSDRRAHATLSPLGREGFPANISRGGIDDAMCQRSVILRCVRKVSVCCLSARHEKPGACVHRPDRRAGPIKLIRFMDVASPPPKKSSADKAERVGQTKTVFCYRFNGSRMSLQPDVRLCLHMRMFSG